MKTIKQTKIATIDPLVSHCYSSSEEINLEGDEFLLNGLIWFGLDTGKRIFITGGSTSDIYVDGSWIRNFSREVAKYGYVVVSSAVSGHSSVQEFLRLYRDGLRLNPEIVVSLSGINDVGFIQSESESPYVHHFQKNMYSKLLPKAHFSFTNKMPSLDGSSYVRNVNYGPPSDKFAFDFWLRNMKLMNACCNINGASHFVFLQPVMGIGSYDLSDLEYAHFSEYCQQNPGYLSNLKEFYSFENTNLLSKYDYINSLVDIFSGLSDCYRDARHPNCRGNDILTEKILQTVFNKSFK